MTLRTCAAAVALAAAFASAPAAAGPVTTGVVVRGFTPSGPVGQKGTPVGSKCDFSNEDVNEHDRMTGASVQCKANSNLKKTIKGLPARFTAYCEVTAKRLGGHLITAPVDGNKNHCDLSDITRKDATDEFSSAVWR